MRCFQLVGMFYQGKEERVARLMTPSLFMKLIGKEKRVKVQLVAEPENTHDSNAVRINLIVNPKTLEMEKLGYVNRTQNAELSAYLREHGPRWGYIISFLEAIKERNDFHPARATVEVDFI